MKKVLAEADVFVSPALLKEYRDVPVALKKRAKIDSFQLKALISGIAAFVSASKVVQPQRSLKICRDPADNMLLECCLEAHTSVLITSDKDLLSVRDLPIGLKTLTPRRYLEDS